MTLTPFDSVIELNARTSSGTAYAVFSARDLSGIRAINGEQSISSPGQNVAVTKKGGQVSNCEFFNLLENQWFLLFHSCVRNTDT